MNSEYVKLGQNVVADLMKGKLSADDLLIEVSNKACFGNIQEAFDMLLPLAQLKADQIEAVSNSVHTNRAKYENYIPEQESVRKQLNNINTENYFSPLANHIARFMVGYTIENGASVMIKELSRPFI